MKRVELIVTHGGMYDKPKLAMYDEDEGFVTVLGRKFLRKGVKTRYRVLKPSHVKAPFGGKGKPLIVCDIATRESINPHGEKKKVKKELVDPQTKEKHIIEVEVDAEENPIAGTSVEISSDEPLDHKKEMGYTFSRDYMKARMEQVKISIRTMLIYAFMGIGAYNVLKMILTSAFGVQLP